jgi:ABC-type branched-subunit amino acid transport system ATPase component
VTTEDASVADEVDRLTVPGLTRRFGALLVLDNVSFSVAAGSVLAVVGPNGAGKTTLCAVSPVRTGPMRASCCSTGE